MGYLFLALYAVTIPTANWLIGNVGTVCVLNGPCLVPVGFGLMAPSGLVLAALALVLRDLVQATLGLAAALGAIAAGTLLSFAIAPPALALASAAAFLLSELLDTGVYTRLRHRGLLVAVLASSLVGLVLDSALFLWMAFGSLDHLAGQVVGKTWSVLIAVTLISLVRRRFARA